MKPIDLRSDTVTRPTQEMYEAMMNARVGDDVYGDDPTVNRLENLSAEIMGKEAALFVPTGTMGNILAIMTHTYPGQEIILGEKCHIFMYEVASTARIAGVQTRPLCGPRGQIPVECIEEAIRTSDIHFPETGLICLENTHNMYGGAVLPLDYMRQVYQLAKNKAIPLHLDGARIFNAAVAIKTDVKIIAQYTDSLMFCLSKGLSAPIGSILVGTHDYINQARKNRKLLGGGMRQAGIMAACGIVGLETMVNRLQQDHDHAKLLAGKLLETGYFITQPEAVKTNIINAVLDSERYNAFDLVKVMAQNGLLANARSQRHFRFVTHKDVSREQIDEAVQILTHILS